MMHASKPQRGAALLIALIMLVMMTIMTIVTFNISKGSLEIVGNMQHRSEGVAAADSAIEEALSTTRLFQSPDTIFLNPCGGVANTKCVDTNGDGLTDIKVVLTPTPTCLQAEILSNQKLDYTKQEDLDCYVGPNGGCAGVEDCLKGDSICANSLWEINAAASDVVTQAQVTVTTGANMRVGKSKMATYCP